MFSSDDNIRNGEIFKYLHEKKILPSYTTIDYDMGQEDKYFYKFASENNKSYLKKMAVLALELKYGIPSKLFFNSKIKNTKDIEDFLRQYKKEKGLFVENMTPDALEAFSEYSNFYIYSNNGIDEAEIVRRKIFIDGQHVIIKNDSTGRTNFEGFVHVSCSSIIMITQNTITRNSVVFKVVLKNIIGDIIPISYLGHRTLDNNEVSGYGICSKAELDDDSVKKFLEIDTSNFSSVESSIIDRIKISKM